MQVGSAAMSIKNTFRGWDLSLPKTSSITIPEDITSGDLPRAGCLNGLGGLTRDFSSTGISRLPHSQLRRSVWTFSRSIFSPKPTGSSPIPSPPPGKISIFPLRYSDRRSKRANTNLSGTNWYTRPINPKNCPFLPNSVREGIMTVPSIPSPWAQEWLQVHGSPSISVWSEMPLRILEKIGKILQQIYIQPGSDWLPIQGSSFPGFTNTTRSPKVPEST